MSVTKLELAQLTRSALMRSAVAVFTAILVYALWLGAAAQSEWAEVVAANRAESEQVLAREQENVKLQRQEGFNPPGAAAAQKMDASLPPAPGVVMAIGDSGLRPRTASVTTSARADTLFKNAEVGSPLAASLGTIDLTWVAIVLLPLLVITLLHDLLAGERDAGRFGLLRAQARSLSGLVWRRLGLRLSVPLLLLVASGAAALVAGTPATLAGLWVLVAALYLLMWGLIATLVSLKSRTAQAATAILLLAWLVLVVVAPAALTLSVERAAAAPSRLSQVISMREVQLDLQSRTDELLERYLIDHPELAGAGRSGFARASFVSQRETEEKLAPLLQRFVQARREQERLTTRMSLLVPPMLVHGALIHLAGTDGARHDAFVEQTLELAANWRARLREPLFLDRPLSVEELAALPRFTFQEPDRHARALGVCGYFLVLAAGLALLIRRALRLPELR